MVLEKILTADNVVVAINQNIDMLLEEVPELKYVINYKRRGREKLDLWSLTLLSLYNSFNDLSVRMTLLFKNLGIVLMNDMNKNSNEIASAATTDILKRCEYNDDFIDEVSFLVRNCNREIEDSLIEENFSLAEKLYKIQLACSMGVLSNDMNKKYLTGVKYKIKKKEKSPESVRKSNRTIPASYYITLQPIL